MLYIDSQDDNSLVEQLKMFAPRVSKYICLPIQKSGFGMKFFINNSDWDLVSNEELFVLKRKPNTCAQAFTYHPDVDYFVKNKVILCTGPSFNKHQFLKNNVEADS